MKQIRIKNCSLTKDTYFCSMTDFIHYKNTKISYTSVGKGKAIVLLHGFLENATMWNEIVPELLKRNRVICIDLLGHGKTECMGYVHTMDSMSEAVAAVLKHLKIRRPILIGHSMGGYVALAFAEKHPQKVKGLCLMNSTTAKDNKERVLLRNSAIKVAQKQFKSLVRLSITNLFKAENVKKYKNEINHTKEQALLTPLQGYIAAQEGMKTRPDRLLVLKNALFPKLYIIGKHDPILPYESLVKEAKKTEAQTVIFPDGHMSHIENKEALILALKHFVNKC